MISTLLILHAKHFQCNIKIKKIEIPDSDWLKRSGAFM